MLPTNTSQITEAAQPAAIHATPRNARWRRIRSNQSGFTLVEVVISALLLAIVTGSAAVAVSQSGKTQVQTKAAANLYAIAQKSLDRLNGDAEAQQRCNTAWKAQYPNFRQCTTKYVMKDNQNRQYDVVTNVKPIDASGDGTGAPTATSLGRDADMNIRDHYDAAVKVTLDQNSRVGVGNIRPVELDGRVDWSKLKDRGLVSVSVCVQNRPDRSLDSSFCRAGDQPMPGVHVQLVPTSDPGNPATSKTGTSNSSGQIVFNGSGPGVEPGTYHVKVSSPQAGVDFYRANPDLVTVQGGGTQQISVTMTRPGGVVRLCGEITNPQNFGYGWDVTSTHVLWNADASPVYRSTKLDLTGASWTCTSGSTNVIDPLQYSKTVLFPGKYGLEVQEVAGELSVTKEQFVSNLSQCGGGAGSLSGSAIKPGKHLSPSWTGYFTQPNTSTTRFLCLQFHSKAVPYNICNTDGKLGGKTCDKQSINHCYANCPSGTTTCVANCGGPSSPPKVGPEPPLIDSSPVDPTAGPNDGTVACGTNPSPGPFTMGNWKQEPGDTSDHTLGSWQSYGYVGGNTYGAFPYPVGYKGNHADGTKCHVQDISFASHTYFGQCIDAQLTLPNGTKTRAIGPADDVLGSGNDDTILWLSIGTIRALLGEPPKGAGVGNGYYDAWDRYNVYGLSEVFGAWPKVRFTHWDPSTTGGTCPMWSTSAAPVYQHVDPVIKPLYTLPQHAPGTENPANTTTTKGNSVPGAAGAGGGGGGGAGAGLGRSL